MTSTAIFDHEKLDVYQLELRFLTWVTQFLADLSRLPATETRELRQQLDRASLSALLNTAEGNGVGRGVSGRSFLMTAAARQLNVRHAWMRPVAKAFAAPEKIQPGKEMLVRVVAMLSKLSPTI